MNLYKNIKEAESQLNSLTSICKAICNNLGAKLIYVDDDEFCYRLPNGQMVTKSTEELKKFVPVEEEHTSSEIDRFIVKGNRYIPVRKGQTDEEVIKHLIALGNDPLDIEDEDEIVE